MSSLIMNMMLGFGAGACACTGLGSAAAASNSPAATAPSLTHLRCRAFICHLPVNECDDRSPVHAGRGGNCGGGLSRRSMHYWKKCRYSHGRRSVADGDSPNSDLYSPANRPNSQNPYCVATSVTVVAVRELSRSAR